MAYEKSPTGPITIERLRALVVYAPDTGEFFSLQRRGRRAAGQSIGYLDESLGYIKASIDGRAYYAHRLAFFYVTGNWPENDVDHIDGNRTNNRWENLRSVTRSINLQNRRTAQPMNSTGLLGVARKRNKFRAQIKVSGKQIALGSFSTPEAAHAAYLAAKRRLHEGNTL